MGFRTLEISCVAEMHIIEDQLEVSTEEGVALIPLEDLTQIMVHGANIRLSTMDEYSPAAWREPPFRTNGAALITASDFYQCHRLLSWKGLWTDRYSRC